MTQTVYDLTVEIAHHLTKLDHPRTWRAKASTIHPGNPEQPGRAELVSIDGYTINLFNRHTCDYNPNRDKVTASPDSVQRKNGQYYFNSAYAQPEINFTPTRPPAAIARDLKRRLLTDAIFWIDKAREGAARMDAESDRQKAYQKMLVDTFGASMATHNNRTVYGKGWTAEVSESGHIYKLEFTNHLTIESVMETITAFESCQA